MLLQVPYSTRITDVMSNYEFARLLSKVFRTTHIVYIDNVTTTTFNLAHSMKGRMIAQKSPSTDVAALSARHLQQKYIVYISSSPHHKLFVLQLCNYHNYHNYELCQCYFNSQPMVYFNCVSCTMCNYFFQKNNLRLNCTKTK